MSQHKWTKLMLLGVGMGTLVPALALGQDDQMDSMDSMDSSQMNSGQTGSMGSSPKMDNMSQMDMDEMDAPAVNRGKVSFDLSVDAVTEYWYRGLAQENQGFLIQPGATVNFDLYEQGDYAVGGYFGTWNSFHFSDGASTGGDLNGNDNAWWESDLYAGAKLSLPKNFSMDLSYIALYNPNGGGQFDEEIDILGSYDDAGFMSDIGLDGFSLAPHALLAFEVDGGADNGSNKGTYLELGVEPSYTVVQSEDYPITLSVPMTLGLGLDDYYEASDGSDDTFGFFDIGAVASAPLPFIPAGYGQWSASAGVHLIVLGNSAAQVSEDFGSSDDSASVYGTLGLSMSY